MNSDSSFLNKAFQFQYNKFVIPYFEHSHHCKVCGVLSLKDREDDYYFLYPYLRIDENPLFVKDEESLDNHCTACDHVWPSNISKNVQMP